MFRDGERIFFLRVEKNFIGAVNCLLEINWPLDLINEFLIVNSAGLLNEYSGLFFS